MSYSKKFFGKLANGEDVYLHTLSTQDFSFSVMDLGACITNIILDKKLDVVSGFDNVTPYEGKCGSMGFTVGRYANRIANAEFALNNVKYQLSKNNGENTLHGGINNFTKKLFEIRYDNKENECLICHTNSSDGEEGYPGNLDFTVKFTLIKPSTIRIEYYASTDKDTIVNFTNHSYFNINGHDDGSILNHELEVNADYVLDIKNDLIPTGKLNDVSGTLFDFRKKKKISEVIDRLNEDTLIAFAGGLDHNFCVNDSMQKKHIATLYADKNEWKMNVYTDQPGVQVYTANTTNIPGGKNNAHYGKYSFVCLETQHYPDSINHKNFPSVVLKPGDDFYSITEYEFIK